MKQFMILMRERASAWAKLSRHERKAWLQKYVEWVRSLKERKIFIAGAPFGGGRLLQRVNGRVANRPLKAKDESLTGYFLILAPTMKRALAVARECPALSHGETVEVRALGH